MTEETKEKIIELALQGWTSKEIEKEFPGFSDNMIFSLIMKEGQDLYERVLMARNLRNKEIVDYDFIEDIIKLVDQGFTFLEIGLIYDKNESEIREILYRVLYTKFSIYQDKELYQKILQKQNNTVKNK